MIRNLFALIALVAAIGIFFLYTDPSYSQIQTLSAQNAQYDAALANATQLEQFKQTLLTRFNSFNPTDLKRLSTMLPDQVDNIRLILDLDNIAASHGMAMQNVNVSASASQSGNTTAVGAITTAQQPYNSLTLQFTTTGTYTQFKQFLGDLQSSLRIVDVVSLVISNTVPSAVTAGQGASAAPQYTYVMTLQTYWLR